MKAYNIADRISCMQNLPQKNGGKRSLACLVSRREYNYFVVNPSLMRNLFIRAAVGAGSADIMSAVCGARGG